MAIFRFKTFNFDECEIDLIKNAMKSTKNLRLFQRYSVILKHFEGFTNKYIAEIECLDAHTVAVYIKNYKTLGLLGLKMNYSTGAKRKLTPVQERIIVQTIINNTPDKLGFVAKKNWTIEIARQWVIKEFGVEMCHRGMAVVLHRLNLSYTRPTYVLKKADEEKQKKFIEEFITIKKNT
jgi:transposase